MALVEPVDRLVKASGLSRRAFAARHSIGEQVLLRLSQGRFTKVPPSVVQALREAYPDPRDMRSILVDEYGTQDIEEAYVSWRESRADAAGRLPTEKELAAANDGESSPAQMLAAAVGSMSKLAAVLQVHDYVVRRYVSGRTRELPASMRAAMEKLSWPHIEHLDKAQQSFLERSGA